MEWIKEIAADIAVTMLASGVLAMFITLLGVPLQIMGAACIVAGLLIAVVVVYWDHKRQ